MSKAKDIDDTWPQDVVGHYLYAIRRQKHATSDAERLELVFTEPMPGKTVVLTSAHNIDATVTDGVFSSGCSNEGWLEPNYATASPEDNEDVRLLFHKLWSRAVAADSHYDKGEWLSLLEALQRGGYKL